MSRLENDFVNMIEDHYKEITDWFINDLLKHPETPSYRLLDRDQLYLIGTRVYRELGKWIAKPYPKEQIAQYYERIGKERYQAGVPAHEVIKALVLQQRHLWLYVLQNLHYDVEKYKQALDLNNRVVLYFDRAKVALIKGYFKAMTSSW